MINEASIAEFRRVSKIHEDWLVYAVVGSDLLTKGELAAVCLYGLPIDYPLDLTTVSYALGKKAAVSSDHVYKSLSYADLAVSLSDLEKSSIMDLRLRAADEIRKVAQYVSTSMQSRMRAAVTKAYETVVSKEPKNAVEFTLSEQSSEIFGTYLTSMRKSMQILTESV